ncbi:MAG: hypothetical protein KI790_05745 [Cyclobacteriaceae bacterium]|nr:hypothetical protein [Cyclobacteriaceae bacterium HetDA_MAG_MS6]
MPKTSYYQSITLQQGGEKLTFEITKEHPDKIISDRTYFWFVRDRVRTTQGGYDGHLLHGTFKAYHENDQLKAKGEMEMGLKEKQWQTWDDTGRLLKEEEYQEGLLDGAVRIYKGDSLYASQQYKTGVLVTNSEQPKKS